MSWKPRPPPPPPPPPGGGPSRSHPASTGTRASSPHSQSSQFRPPPPPPRPSGNGAVGSGNFRPPPPPPQAQAQALPATSSSFRPPPPSAPFSAPPAFHSGAGAGTGTGTGTGAASPQIPSGASRYPPPPPTYMTVNTNTSQPGPPGTPVQTSYPASSSKPPPPSPHQPGAMPMPPGTPQQAHHAQTAQNPATHNHFHHKQSPPPINTPNYSPNTSAMPPVQPSYGGASRLMPVPPSANNERNVPRVIPILPTPDVPTKPHTSNTSTGLETYYPKGHFLHATTSTSQKTFPPVVGRSIVLDDGNASPYFISSAMYAIPQDRSILKHTGLSSVNLMVTPMALPSQEYITPSCLQSSHLPESGRLGYVSLSTEEAPERCRRCQAYGNPWISTTGNCNFCGSSISVTGRQSVGTIDFPVDGPYITRSTPVKPNILWAIDMTLPCVRNVLDLILQQVLPQWIVQAQAHAHQVECRAGIVLVTPMGLYLPLKQSTRQGSDFDVWANLYSSTVLEEEGDDSSTHGGIYFEEYTWNLNVPQQATAMQERWSELLYPGEDGGLSRLLQVVATRKLAQDQPAYQMSSGGAALTTMLEALETTGGRAVYVSWRRPNHGIGKLSDARNKQQSSTANNNITIANDFYAKLGSRATRSQVAIDMVFLTDPSVPQSFLDIATLRQACQLTNGRFTWIQSSNLDSAWKESLSKAFIRPLQFCGWDAVLKVRVSNGMRVKALESSVGRLLPPSSLSLDDTPELEFSVVTPDTTIGIALEHRVGGLPKNTQFVYVQSALLYTNPWNGKRRVRVSTLALRVAPNAQVAFDNMEFNTLACSLVRKTVQTLSPPPGQQAPESAASNDTQAFLLNQCVAILMAYRKYGASLNAKASSVTQLMLPPKLTLLPLLIMSLLKSQALQSGKRPVSSGLPTSNMSDDEKAYHLYYWGQTSPTMALWNVFPLLIDLHAPSLRRFVKGKLYPDAHLLDILKQSPYLAFPEPLLPSRSELIDNHSYLLVTGLHLYVIVGQDVSAEDRHALETALVSAPSSMAGSNWKENKGTDADDNEEEEKMHGVGENLQRVLRQVRVWSQVGSEPRWLRPTWETVSLVTAQDVSQWLVADPIYQVPEYASFLADLQRRIIASMNK